jgi:FkbM family methyltransferase
VGSFPNREGGWKDRFDYALTRVPSLYFWLELHRRWINWDKRVYLFFVRNGDTVFDVGANVGTHTSFLSHLAGGRGAVLSYEPLETSFDRLTATIRQRCRFRNVRAFQRALGAPAVEGASATMRIPDGDFTQASLETHDSASWAGRGPVTTAAVTVASIDAEVRRLGVDHVDFIKIDVEGGELDVLKGGVDTVRRFRPFIYCEVYEAWTKGFGYLPAQLFDYLASLGYVGVRVFHQHEIHALELGRHIPSGLFSVSSDALFFTRAQAPSVAKFDRALARAIRAESTGDSSAAANVMV